MSIKSIDWNDTHTHCIPRLETNDDACAVDNTDIVPSQLI